MQMLLVTQPYKGSGVAAAAGTGRAARKPDMSCCSPSCRQVEISMWVSLNSQHRRISACAHRKRFRWQCYDAACMAAKHNALTIPLNESDRLAGCTELQRGSVAANAAGGRSGGRGGRGAAPDKAGRGAGGSTVEKGEPLLVLEEVSKSHDGDTQLFKDVSFTVCRGERLAIVGTNGSGEHA